MQGRFGVALLLLSCRFSMCFGAFGSARLIADSVTHHMTVSLLFIVEANVLAWSIKVRSKDGGL